MKDEMVTLDALAAKLEQFGYDFDPYEYMDSVETREEGLAQIREDLRQGNFSGYREYLQEVAEDGEDFAPEAEQLLDMMDRYENRARLSVEDKQSILAWIDELSKSKPILEKGKVVLAKEEVR